MNREIKFRAWDKTTNNMLIPFIVGAPCVSENDLFILMQYTGLKDKNGVEIYEGDIVRWNNEVFVFRWVENSCQFGLYTFNPEKVGTNKEWNFEEGAVWQHDMEVIEVIGNIYQNPELLTK